MGDTFSKTSISAVLAQRMVTAAQAKATEIGVPVNIAVVDESGVLKAFCRMDGAALPSVQIAQDKAYTGAGFGRPSHGWYDLLKDDPQMVVGATAGIDRLIIFGGGYPITVDGVVVGGVGVSGGEPAEDMQVAEAALAVLPR